LNKCSFNKNAENTEPIKTITEVMQVKARGQATNDAHILIIHKKIGFLQNANKLWHFSWLHTKISLRKNILRVIGTLSDAAIP